MSVYCTVVANNSDDPITGVGILAYPYDGSNILCVQYTNDFSSASVMTSVGMFAFFGGTPPIAPQRASLSTESFLAARKAPTSCSRTP